MAHRRYAVMCETMLLWRGSRTKLPLISPTCTTFLHAARSGHTVNSSVGTLISSNYRQDKEVLEEGEDADSSRTTS